ncbi:MAG: hypothetical protein CTY12_03375 [Methylotenera sp.]|nr:MAG: hypothetical protein CTY12_03375 [Methylotenera sp.]
MYIEVKIPLDTDGRISVEDQKEFEEHLQQMLSNVHKLLYVNEPRICSVARYRFLTPIVTLRDE